MLNIKSKSQCCGCSACFNICPKDAVEMKEDEYGFRYPVINEEKCINCGLCEQKCPILKGQESNNNPIAFACINKDESIRKKSSSGGIFSLVADYILENNGVVFGAAFDDKFDVKHIYAENREELSKLRGSKYVQSSIGKSYREAKEFLDNGRKVLFTGTPCQIEGLLSYLNKEYKNLYTQDIICHGVPSPKVWRYYKDYRKKIDNEEPKEINFRNKDTGWNNYSLNISYNGNKYSKSQREDVYMRAFLKNISLRDSCYECSFKKFNRLSDVTLADFWGVKDILPDFEDDKGTSLMIVNSEKGGELFNAVKEKCKYKEVNLNGAVKYNSAFTNSVNQNKNREKFFEQFENDDFEKLVLKYAPEDGFIKKIIRKMKRAVKKVIKK